MPRRAVLVNSIPNPNESCTVFEGDDADIQVRHYVNTTSRNDKYAECIVKAWIVRNGSGYWRKLYRQPMLAAYMHYKRPPLRWLFQQGLLFFRAAVHDEGRFAATFYTNAYGTITYYTSVEGYMPFADFLDAYGRIWDDLIESGMCEHLYSIAFQATYCGESERREWKVGETKPWP